MHLVYKASCLDHISMRRNESLLVGSLHSLCDFLSLLRDITTSFEVRDAQPVYAQNEYQFLLVSK